MKLLILKTNLKTKKRIKSIQHLLSNNPVILNWNIDSQDIDNILRIEAQEQLSENDLISQLRLSGVDCEELAY